MTTNSLSVFQFHTHQVRVFPSEDGLSFVAVAKDVATVLGYATAKDAVRYVPDSHKGRLRVPTPSGEQEMLTVDEAGLYRLVLRSNKPEAEPFMEWITAEVLPAIRRTGGYVRPGAESLALAREVGALRDQIAQQGEMILGLYQELDGARRGHIRALTSLARIHKREATREALDTVVRMEAAGRPRDEIARATGKTLNHIRQIVLRARRDGRLPDRQRRLDLGGR